MEQHYIQQKHPSSFKPQGCFHSTTPTNRIQKTMLFMLHQHRIEYCISMSFHSQPSNQILHINAFQSVPFLSNLHPSPSQLITLISNSIDTALIQTPTQSQLSHHADQHNPNNASLWLAMTIMPINAILTAAFMKANAKLWQQVMRIHAGFLTTALTGRSMALSLGDHCEEVVSIIRLNIRL